jgi:hypothetical protein
MAKIKKGLTKTGELGQSKVPVLNTVEVSNRRCGVEKVPVQGNDVG